MSGGPVPVVLFTDFASPYARVTEEALHRLEDEGTATVARMAYELYPEPTPLPGGDEPGDPAALEPLAAELSVRLSGPWPPVRTRKAHEAAAHAAARGVGPAFRRAVWDARFAEGADIGRVDVLVELGVGLGLDRSELQVVLDVDRYAPRISAERAAAARAGVTGVPTLVAGEGGDARWWTGAGPLAELRRWVLGND